MIDLDGEELDLVPGVDLGGAAGEEGDDALEALAEGGEAVLLDAEEVALGDEVADLEVVAAVDEDDDAAEVDVAEGVFGVVGLAGDAEPEDVDGDALLFEGEVRGDAGEGVAAVAADGEGGGDLDRAVGGVGADAGGGAVVLEEAGRLPSHAELEGGVARGLLGEEVEEIPLRHEGDELRVGGEVGEVRHGEALAADDRGEAGDLGVRELEEAVEEAELVEALEGGGVDGVAAEVAEEVGVLFEHGDGKASAGEQQAEHHPCRTAADDAGVLHASDCSKLQMRDARQCFVG